MDRFGHNIRSDVRKQESEISDLPILCETCLGENPYVRIIRDENGKECKICKNPFTHFRWKPGQKGRYKQTIICSNCAKFKNVCQTCLFDLDYNLPVQVRDKFLREEITLPENDMNKNFFLEQVEKNRNITLCYNKLNRTNKELSKLKRYDPYFKRNMPRVCSFWKKNSCTRGDECPYLHKEIHLDKSLSNQNIKNRYNGKNDILAEKILSKVKKEEKVINGSYKENTICINGVGKNIREENLIDNFKKFGEIIKIEKKPQNLKVYITFGNTVSAENAYKEYNKGILMNGTLLHVALESGDFIPIYRPPNKTPQNYNLNNMINMFHTYNDNEKSGRAHNKPVYPSLIPSEAQQRR